MPRFIRSVLAQDEAVTVSTVVTYDLPVNPLSHFLFTLRALNNTGTITDYQLIVSFMSQVSNISVLYKGQAIISGSLQDIMMLNYLVTGKAPWGCNILKTDDAVRSWTFPVSFGRRWFDVMEAFPATRKGELQLQVTYAAAQTGIDNISVQVETVEMLDVQPGAFLKYTTLTKTPTSTGFHDVDLPIGNDILGVLLFGTTVPSSTSFNATIGQVKLLLDNVEYGYSLANWESMHGELGARWGDREFYGQIHRGNFTTTVEGDTGLQQYPNTVEQLYAFLDYDPHMDGEWAIPTAGHARCNLRINQEPTADAMRAVPVELIRIAS